MWQVLSSCEFHMKTVFIKVIDWLKWLKRVNVVDHRRLQNKAYVLQETSDYTDLDSFQIL